MPATTTPLIGLQETLDRSKLFLSERMSAYAALTLRQLAHEAQALSSAIGFEALRRHEAALEGIDLPPVNKAAPVIQLAEPFIEYEEPRNGSHVAAYPTGSQPEAPEGSLISLGEVS